MTESGSNDGRLDTIRVVVVDDQPLERTGNALILDSDDEIEVVAEAGNGVDAIAAVARTRPDVVLMDVRMPVMDGLTATGVIAERHPGARVIVLTTFDLDEYAFGALRVGASAFLLKSTKPAALIDAVKTVASGSAVAAPRLTSKLIEHYLQRSPTRAEDAEAVLDILSPRERDVFAAIVRGLSNAEIGDALVLAPSTVKSHVNAIFAKLALRDRVQAVILGYELGLATRA
ncbi:response regulator transcription factor [Microbacterium sp. TNHR37B]|uniref:response regulator transcription factor n=1 Tax=Microbacterium sp. TNHR37B TaxID=1775956 RepID=UPI0007B29918|nr:response regulator transcription factor [Microbacterium sp. TNHR37B]KZE90553.1 Oxygen regulatory protein NreC [Microbacterium sp. TNHR37B]